MLLNGQKIYNVWSSVYEYNGAYVTLSNTIGFLSETRKSIRADCQDVNIEK
jgi:hypothetical protein